MRRPHAAAAATAAALLLALLAAPTPLGAAAAEVAAAAATACPYPIPNATAGGYPDFVDVDPCLIQFKAVLPPKYGVSGEMEAEFTACWDGRGGNYTPLSYQTGGFDLAEFNIKLSGFKTWRIHKGMVTGPFGYGFARVSFYGPPNTPGIKSDKVDLAKGTTGSVQSEAQLYPVNAELVGPARRLLATPRLRGALCGGTAVFSVHNVLGSVLSWGNITVNRPCPPNRCVDAPLYG